MTASSSAATSTVHSSRLDFGDYGADRNALALAHAPLGEAPFPFMPGNSAGIRISRGIDLRYT